MGFWDSVLDVLSAPAKLFTGDGAIAKGVKSLFGRETGALTPALNEVAKAASVVDAKGNVTASSLANGLLKAPGAIANFAEKEAVPALNFAEKTLGDLKSKVEKIPIVGAELGGALGALETPLKEVSGVLEKGQEVLGAVKTPAETILRAKEQGEEVLGKARGIIDAVKRRDLGSAVSLGKGAIESGQKALEIGKMGVQQFKTMEVKSSPNSDLMRNIGAQQAPRFANRGARVAL